jgi:hypothetical protein
MPAAVVNGTTKPTRGRLLVAGVVVALTLIATWKFINHRTQPPPPEEVTSDR